MFVSEGQSTRRIVVCEVGGAMVEQWYAACEKHTTVERGRRVDNWSGACDSHLAMALDIGFVTHVQS